LKIWIKISLTEIEANQKEVEKMKQAEIAKKDFISTELAKYDLPDARIAELKEKYLSVEVKDAKDATGYMFCKRAHQEVREIRVSIEKKRVELKSESLKFGKAVDAEAKRLSGEVGAIEAHLYEQRRVVESEKERIKKEKEEAIRVEAERKRQEEEARMEAIRQEQEETARKIREEQERIEAEKRKIEEEKERIAEEKAQIERDKQAAIEAEKQRKIEIQEREEAEKQRAIELEQAKKEAAEKAKLEAEENQRRKVREAEAARIAEAE